MKKYDNVYVRKEYLSFILKFNKEQLDMISYAKNIGLTLGQINIFAHPNFNSVSMMEIINCIREGMPKEQLKVVANPEFKNLGKIIQAKIGFEQGLSIDEVLQYAKPEFTITEMIEMRTAIKEAKEE